MGTDAGWRPLRAAAARSGVEVGATPFSRLAVTHALAVSGDALVTMALAGSLFFDISPSAARGRVALSLVLTIAPFGLVAPFLGPAIDRISGGRRLMVLAAAASRGVTAFLAARVLDGLLLFPAAFFLLVLSKTHAVAKSSLVPTVVESKDDLVAANSRLSLLSAVVSVVTAVPGVAVLKLLGAEWVMRLAAVAFVAAAVASTRIVQVRPDQPRPPGPGGAGGTGRPRFGEGIRRGATVTGVLRASIGFLTFLVAFGLRRADAPAWVFGLVLVASMAGTLVGAVTAPVLRRRVAEEHLLEGALWLVVAGAIVATRLGTRPAAVVAAFVLGLAASTGKLGFDSLVQRDAPDAAQGRAFARFEAAFQLAWVAGAIVPVALAVPARGGYVALAVASCVTALAYLLAPDGRRPGVAHPPESERA